MTGPIAGVIMNVILMVARRLTRFTGWVLVAADPGSPRIGNQMTVGLQASNLDCSTVNPKKLETRLRTISAGIPYA